MKKEKYKNKEKKNPEQFIVVRGGFQKQLNHVFFFFFLNSFETCFNDKSDKRQSGRYTYIVTPSSIITDDVYYE